MSGVRSWTPRQDDSEEGSEYNDPFNSKKADKKSRDKERADNLAAGYAAGKDGLATGYSAGKDSSHLDESERRFRFAHVLKPGFDFSILRNYCERIVFSTDGYGDNVPNLREQLEESMDRFDPDKDVLIPIGSATICTLAATLLVRRMIEHKEKNWTSYAMGVYSEGDYQFWRVPISPEEEVYDILQR